VYSIVFVILMFGRGARSSVSSRCGVAWGVEHEKFFAGFRG
jgi:hypothetical protein